MMVIPDVRNPGMKPAPLGMQPLPATVGSVRPMGPPGPRNGPVDSPQAGQGPGIFNHRAVRTDCELPNADVHSNRGTVPHRRRIHAVLNTETGEPASCRAVDRNLLDHHPGTEGFNHEDPADLGQDDRFAIHPDRVRPVIGAKTLLMTAPFVPGETHPPAA